MKENRALFAALCAVLCAAVPAADTIHKTDGKRIEGCVIVDETIGSVVYRESGKRNEDSLPTDQVLDIVYSKLPDLVEEAQGAFEEGDAVGAIELLEQYLAGDLSKEKKKWAPAFAARRVMELRSAAGDAPGVVAAADRLLERFPESRYVPEAYLAKASALARQGQAGPGRAALQELQSLVESKGLSDRYRLECRLGLVITDLELKGEARRQQLDQIQRDAEAFPTVRNRARVARAESLLQDGKFDEAATSFRELAADGKADDATLAATYTGLGDCLYQKGASANDKPTLREAAHAYMRVVVLYAEQSTYVPRALFYAGRSFQLLGGETDREHARELYRKLIQRYGNHELAKEAKLQLK